MQIKEIKKKIEENLPESIAHVTSADNIHFDARVYCPQFAELNLVKQHQLVYQAIGNAVGVDIHALTLFTTSNKDKL